MSKTPRGDAQVQGAEDSCGDPAGVSDGGEGFAGLSFWVQMGWKRWLNPFWDIWGFRIFRFLGLNLFIFLKVFWVWDSFLLTSSWFETPPCSISQNLGTFLRFLAARHGRPWRCARAARSPCAACRAPAARALASSSADRRGGVRYGRCLLSTRIRNSTSWRVP